MSFQRITTIGSIPAANSDAIASRDSRSPSFSRWCISTRWPFSSPPRRSVARASLTAGGGGDEDGGELLGLLHRRLDSVQAERVRGLLRVVDDVVERAHERVQIARVERGAGAGLPDAVEDVVGEPVTLLLADEDLACELGPLGEVSQHLVQQRARSDGIGAGPLEQLQQVPVACAPEEPQVPDGMRTGLTSRVASTGEETYPAGGAGWSDLGRAEATTCSSSPVSGWKR